MRLSRILAIAFVIGCGSQGEAPSAAEEAPATGAETNAGLEPAAPERAEVVEPEPVGASLDPDEVDAREVGAEEAEAIEATEPAPSVRRRPRRLSPSGAASRSGGAVYDIEE